MHQNVPKVVPKDAQKYAKTWANVTTRFPINHLKTTITGNQLIINPKESINTIFSESSQIQIRRQTILTANNKFAIVNW